MCCTVLVSSKLKKINATAPQPQRNATFQSILRYLRTLLGVSPGSKLCTTFLNIAKYFKTLRCGFCAVAFIFSIYLKPVLYVLFHGLYKLELGVPRNTCVTCPGSFRKLTKGNYSNNIDARVMTNLYEMNSNCFRKILLQ